MATARASSSECAVPPGAKYSRPAAGLHPRRVAGRHHHHRASIGLLLPAVFRAIEAAHRIACLNNIKQIGLALNNYEATMRQYPTNWGQVGTVGTPSPAVQANIQKWGVSWMVQILPYIDEVPLYQSMNLTQPLGFVDNANGYNNSQAGQHRVV